MSGAARLARLLGDDGRCLDVAIDHGVFNEPGFLPGIEDMARAVETVVRAGAAGIVYGRNIIQHRDPAGMTRAFMQIVHGGASPEAAAQVIAGQ